ncbi:hypothetical protein LINPERPRIM_LOCUS38837 [Linum perenne]
MECSIVSETETGNSFELRLLRPLEKEDVTTVRSKIVAAICGRAPPDGTAIELSLTAIVLDSIRPAA